MEQPPKQVESDRVLYTVLEDAEYSHMGWLQWQVLTPLVRPELKFPVLFLLCFFYVCISCALDFTLVSVYLVFFLVFSCDINSLFFICVDSF